MNQLTPHQMNTLRSQFSSVKTITPEHHQRLKQTIGAFNPDTLAALADSGIPFIRTAANSVLCDRGIRPESARWEHAIDVITDSLMRQQADRRTALAS